MRARTRTHTASKILKSQFPKNASFKKVMCCITYRALLFLSNSFVLFYGWRGTHRPKIMTWAFLYGAQLTMPGMETATPRIPPCARLNPRGSRRLLPPGGACASRSAVFLRHLEAPRGSNAVSRKVKIHESWDTFSSQFKLLISEIPVFQSSLPLNKNKVTFFINLQT